MSYWPFGFHNCSKPTLQGLDKDTNMADHVDFAKRVHKSLYYGEYSDASLPSLSVTDVAVEVLNNSVPPHQRILDRKHAHSVARRAKISPCALMMGMLYAERLRQKHSHWSKTLSSSDLFLVSIMVASKYLYDEGEDEEVYNDDWAKAGLKTVQNVNQLESDFLKMMDWNLFISKEEFSNFVSKVESRVAVTKGLSRGWLTYHDMFVLLGNPNMIKTLIRYHHQLLKAISSCLAAYIVGVSILLGSSTLAFNRTHSNIVKTTSNSAFNCLTTEADCLFTRDFVALPMEDSGRHTIAAKRPRSMPRILAPRSLGKKNVTHFSVTEAEKLQSTGNVLQKQKSNVENQSSSKNLTTTFLGFDNSGVLSGTAKRDKNAMSGHINLRIQPFLCAFAAKRSSLNSSMHFYPKQGFCNG